MPHMADIIADISARLDRIDREIAELQAEVAELSEIHVDKDPFDIPLPFTYDE